MSVRKTLYHKVGGTVTPVMGVLNPNQAVPAAYVAATTQLASITVTASNSTNTKGAWTEIIASAPADYTCLEIYIEATNINGGNSNSLLDIGFGSAGAETVVVANLSAGFRATGATNSSPPDCYIIPINVPSGTRISARLQSATASHTAAVKIRPINIAPIVRKNYAIDTIGAVTATSQGKTLPVPGSLNVKGAYDEITAATTQDYIALIVGIQGAGASSFSNGNVGIDIASGASGAEVDIISDIIVSSGTAETYSVQSPRSNLFYVDLPAGTRLSGRYQRSATNLAVDVILYGVREI